MPITEINQLPSRNNPETFAVDTEVTFDQLSQAIRDINDIGSIINTQITGTSTTSITIGTGAKSLTVQAGLSLVPGYPVRIAYTTTPTDNMDGTVTTYNSSTGALVVNVASVNGSGTYANWQVMVLPSATGNFADKSTANTFTDVQTFSGGVSANQLVKKQSDPTLGGAFLLEKSSGSSLGGNLKIELSGNSVRIYENGGSNRGLTVDLTTLDASIAFQLITSALKGSSSDVVTGTNDNKYLTPKSVKDSALIQNRTVQTTSGAAFYDFTIPSGAKRIKLMLDQVSTNGTSQIAVRLGDSGGIVTTGYISIASVIEGSSAGSANSSAAFILENASTAAFTRTGSITLEKITGNTWVTSSSMAVFGAANPRLNNGAGSIELTNQLTTIRLTTLNGTDLFDLGSINVSYEF